MDIILNNVLDVSEFKHYRINHSKLFADKQNHINGIENFWNQAKRHMRRFNGIPAKHFPLFLKECEWRFNNPNPKAQKNYLNNGLRVVWASYLGQPQIILGPASKETPFSSLAYIIPLLIRCLTISGGQPHKMKTCTSGISTQ